MQSVLGPGHLVAGRYRLLDQVGRGAMGIVWRCHDDLLDREVAVKQIVLPPMATDADAQASYQRTLREARTAARLSHPGLVTVFDVLDQDGMPWIVMELVQARPLDQVIAEDGPLPPADAARLGRELLDALACAHAAGVLHRDVKPSNVLIGRDGKPVLTDFGIAMVQGDPRLTQIGLVVGTPGFAPPERVRGEPATEACDMWSLGATLYAAVEGRGPFDRAGGSAAIVASVASEPAPRAPSAGPLGPVIEALLRTDPALRPGAVTTARMLAQAEAACRDPRQATQSAAVTPAHDAGSGRPASADATAAAPPEATTATQVVHIPAVADPAADLAGGTGPRGGTGLRGGTGNAQHGTGLQPAQAAPADAASPPGSAAAPAGASSQAGSCPPVGPASPGPRADVVPDLMATPVFAELTMPAPPGSPDLPQHTSALGHSGPLGRPGPLGSGDPLEPAGAGRTDRAARRGLRVLAGRTALAARSKRTLVLATAAVAVIGVICGVWIAFPGLTATLAQNFEQLTGKSASAAAPHLATAAHHGHHGPAARRRAGGGTGGSGGTGGTAPPTRSTPPAGRHTPGTPRPSGKASPSGNRSPSGHPTPSQSPSPSPTPSPTGARGGPRPLPPGYAWHSVSPASVGSTAGFRLAAPVHWLMYPALVTVFRPPAGSIRMKVNMTPSAAAGPVRRARHAQASATAAHRYPHYHLVSILAVTFHGYPAATWTFWWRPPGSLVAVDMTEVFFTISTAAGPQSYVLIMSTPATRADWASKVFRVAMRTFRPLP